MKNSKGKEQYNSVIKGIATKASETCDYWYINEWFNTNYPTYEITQSSGRFCNYDGKISIAGDTKSTYEAKGRWNISVSRFPTAYIDVEKIQGLNGICWNSDTGQDNDKRTLFILYPDSNLILSYDSRWIENNVKHHIIKVKDSVLQGETELRAVDVYELPIPNLQTDESGQWKIQDFERDVWVRVTDEQGNPTGKNEKIHYQLKDENGRKYVNIMNVNMKKYYEMWQLYYDNMKAVYDERTLEIQAIQRQGN